MGFVQPSRGRGGRVADTEGMRFAFWSVRHSRKVEENAVEQFREHGMRECTWRGARSSSGQRSDCSRAVRRAMPAMHLPVKGGPDLSNEM